MKSGAVSREAIGSTFRTRSLEALAAASGALQALGSKSRDQLGAGEGQPFPMVPTQRDPGRPGCQEGDADDEENTRTLDTLPTAPQGEATQREGRGDPGVVAWGAVFPQTGDKVGDA